MRSKKETSYGSDYSGLIWKSIFITLILAALIVLNSNIPGIPVSNSNLAAKEKELNRKNQEISKMSRQIEMIRTKEPLLRSSMAQMTSGTGVFQDKKKKSVVEIPSMLVYLEQVGKRSGLTIKKIDIAGLENKSAKTDEDVEGPKNSNRDVAATQNTSNGGTEFVITAVGSYDSFVSYIKEIQINTKEQVNIVDFKVSPSDKTLNYCEIELKISL